MRAGPKTWSIILLFVVLVCGQMLADSQPTLSMSTDEPVSVVTVRSQTSTSSSIINRCLVTKSAVPSFTVRFQKLKGKTATYTRTLLERKTIQTYATGRKVVSMTNIANCVKLADAEGFVGFSFNGGTCDLFNMDFQLCGCVTGAKDVFYVQESFWDTKAGGSQECLHPSNLVEVLPGDSVTFEPSDQDNDDQKRGWLFTTGPGSTFTLTCSKFSLKMKDKLTVEELKENVPKSYTFCLKDGPRKLKLDSKRVKVMFKYEKKANRGSFSCKITASCVAPTPTTTSGSTTDIITTDIITTDIITTDIITTDIITTHIITTDIITTDIITTEKPQG